VSQEPDLQALAAKRRDRIRLFVLVSPIVVLSIAATVADWFAAAIITREPVLQILLNPRLRYLALASNQLDAVTFFAVSFVRLVLTDPLYYLLGLWYGDRAVRWVERNWTGEGSLKATERWFRRAAYPVVALAPNGLVCILAGATGMAPPVFIALNVGGTIARLILVRIFASALEEPLDWLLRFIGRYQWWLVGLSVALGLVQFTQNRRSRRREAQVTAETDEAEPDPSNAP
jgi:membrane protein DedA with SNARE-associated domain